MPATSNRVDQLTPSLRAVAQRFTAPACTGPSSGRFAAADDAYR